MLFDYEGTRRISYDCGEDGIAVFLPVCVRCGRFVKADATVRTNSESGWDGQPNADCKRCGRVRMPFEGFFAPDEEG